MLIVEAPLVIDGKELAVEALTLIATLMEKLPDSTVALQDLQRHEAHTKMVDWMTFPAAPDETPVGVRDPDGGMLSVPINWRWKLWASPYRVAFPADAFDLVVRTAKALASFLPAEKMPDVPAPTGGAAGGSSGPAELGIPVDWVRKVRN